MRIKIQDKVYEIKIAKLEDGVKITVDGREFIFGAPHQIIGGGSISQTSFPKRDFSKKEIKAPLTGMISEIFVKEGEFLKKGKKIFLLSAMKMENELVSEFEGRVKKILVKKEQKVKVGETLIVIE